jgi:UDP-2-acetamido-3-amino-2,3-dideoxy-glucuronate N-acetyltransferase
MGEYSDGYDAAPAEQGIGCIIDETVRFGNNVKLGNYTIIAENSIIGANTVIGDFVKLCRETKIGESCRIDDYVTTSGPVEIGDRIRIKRCTMIGHATRIESDAWVGACVKTTKIKYPKVISEEEEYIEWITIKRGAMIGSGSLLLAGVTIGEGAVVAAGAIVAENCEPYGIYRNEKAKLVGYRRRS